MNSQTKNRARLLFTFLLISLTCAFSQDRKMEEEEIQLRNHVYELFDGNDSVAFVKAVNNLADYYRKSGDWHQYYTARENEIVYEINHDHYYQALKKTSEMNSDILENGLKDELYRMNYLMGVFYGSRDNNEMCEKYLNLSLEQMGSSQQISERVNIYLMLANIHIFDNPDLATININKAAKVSSGNHQLSAVLDMKCMIEFSRNDKESFHQVYTQIQQIKENTPDEYNPTYERYVNICRTAFDGDYDEAIRQCNDLIRGVERYQFLCKIHEMRGDKNSLIASLRKLIEAKEERNNKISTMEINDISHDMKLERARRETRRAYSLAILLAFIAAIIAVIPLSVFGWSRRKHVQALQAQNRELRRARDHAEEADRMKTAFIRNISHHIRTPLNVVSGFSNILAKQVDELSQEEREDLSQRINHNVYVITNSLNHLIALSEVESVRVSDTEDEVNCNNLCQSIADDFKPINEKLSFTYTTSVDNHTVVKTNKDRLRSVVMELLINADKFAGEGEIMLNSDIVGDTWQISVTDTGKGIGEGDEEKIFGHFAKIDDFTEGLGIGLTYCKSIASQLGGDVTLDKSYTDGARFIVTVPLRQA